jgi:error-prone DNA polymerase
MGFRYVAGLGTSGISRILQARQAGPFTSVADCAARTGLARAMLEQLVAAGSFDRFGQDRRALFWEVGRFQYAPDELDLPIPASPVELPALSDAEKHWLEQRALGISTSEHPLAHWRDALARQGYTNTWEIIRAEARQQVRLIASVVVIQAPPTARGFAFVTVEDEFGLVQVILRPALAHGARLRRQAGILIEIEGVVQREGEVVNLLATRVAQRKR